MPRLREFRWDSWVQARYREYRADVEHTREGCGPHAAPMVAVDTETTGVEYYDTPFAATLTWRRPNGELRSVYFDLESEGADNRKFLLSAWLHLAGTWVFHNAKFDLQKLLLAGVINEDDIERTEIHDTQTLYHLLDENGRKGLKHLAVTVLGYDDTVEVPYSDSGPKKGQTRKVSREKYQLDKARRQLKLTKDDGYHLLPREIVVPYALRDTEFTLRLYETLWPKLEKRGDGLVELYAEAIKLKRALLRMEADGFGLDLYYLDVITSEYGVKVMESWNEIVELTGKPDLNPNAPGQLMEAFAERGLVLDSTDVDTLRPLDDELARAVLAYRENQKMHKTYLLGLQRAQKGGIVHPSFNDDGAKTGRMSSGKATA